jgi:3-oxoacyl-[acyl-carrier protein] reductase
VRTAVVTGASRGLGAAFARVLAEEGCDLALGARSRDDVEALADRLAAERAVEVLAAPLDVTDPDSLATFRTATVDRFGRVDVVVANAGIGRFARVEDTRAEDVRAMLDVNVTGLVSTLATFAADLEAAPTRGLVVTVTSDVSDRVFPGGAAYVASKHAARAISRTFQQEHPQLRVCELRPGSTTTGFGDRDPSRPTEDGHLTADQVAEVLRVVLAAPDDVRVEELVVRDAGQHPDF